MGIEYRLSCPPAGLPKLAAFLRQVGGHPSAQPPGGFEFRFGPAPSGGVPDVTAVLEPGGLYLCDHGEPRDAVALFFRRVVDELLSLSDASDSVVITSL